MNIPTGEYEHTFSPPDKFEMFFQLFFGGITLKFTPSEKGSIVSTRSSSAFPPSVIIYSMSHEREDTTNDTNLNSLGTSL